MGTRSFNILSNPKGDFIGSYCHWDGYPSNNGRLLLLHYASKSKARQLVQLGDLSSLGERAVPLSPEGHSYETKEEGTTVAYFRDREGYRWGEVKPKRFDSALEAVLYAGELGCEFVYLYWNGHWSYGTPTDAIIGKPFEMLTLANTEKEDDQ